MDTQSIQTRRLGTSDIPVIGLGTWQTFDVGRNVADRISDAVG